MLIGGTEIKVVQGDITELKVDAIVNAANNKLVMGGGVAGAIKRKGGKAIEDEAIKKGPIEIGAAVETSAGSLSSKYVIHTATMGMDFKTDEHKVRNSCRNSFDVAERLKIKSIAFPALGCGAGGFGLVAAAKIMAQEVMRHLKQGSSSLKEIIFCMYDKEAFEAFDKNIFGYLKHFVSDFKKGPYVTVDAIIELDDSIVLIERLNPPFGWALPGGFVDEGESLEDAVTREAKEETGLDIFDLKQLHTYSEPHRDPRFHTISTVYTAKAKGKPKAGDDAANVKLVKLSDMDKINFAFDHKSVIEDYIKFKKTK